MIKESYVSLGTAMLLKEKGFNEKCWYVIGPSGKIAAPYFMEGEPMVDNDDINSMSKYTNKSLEVFLCPTQSVVNSWLREVHKLHIYTFFIGGEWVYTVENFETGDEYSNQEGKTSEEAVEAALKFTLEHLI